MAKLPKTQARLSYSIKLYLIKSSVLTPEILRKPESIKDLSPRFIDGVEKFHEVEDRITDPRYELDGKKTGDVVGRILKTVEKRLSIDRAVMYKGDVADIFNIPERELVDQTTPFALLKIEKAPEGSGIPDKVTLYLDCYLHNLPQTYELGRDMKVVQSINLGYRDKVNISGGISL